MNRDDFSKQEVLHAPDGNGMHAVPNHQSDVAWNPPPLLEDSKAMLDKRKSSLTQLLYMVLLDIRN